MGELSFDKLRDRLARGELGGSYFLKAEDRFLRDEAIGALSRAHLAAGSPDFDLDQVAGSEIDAEALASRLETPPMLSPYRLVVIREIQELAPSARKVLQEAVAAPAPNRVIVAASEKARRSRAKIFGELARHCIVVSLRQPRESELPGWLVERARNQHDAEIDVVAAQRLVAAVGRQLGALTQELDKLVTYVAPRRSISLEDVESAVGALPRADRWGWVDRVLDRKFAAAADELHALLDSGESPVGLIASLAEALLRVGLAGAGRDTLIATLERDGSYHNLKWKVPIYARQARGWTEEAIDAALAELLRADRLIKSGGLGDRSALEEAILRIAAAPAGMTRRPATAGR